MAGLAPPPRPAVRRGAVQLREGSLEKRGWRERGEGEGDVCVCGASRRAGEREVCDGMARCRSLIAVAVAMAIARARQGTRPSREAAEMAGERTGVRSEPNHGDDDVIPSLLAHLIDPFSCDSGSGSPAAF